jgi:hypothetical protein
MLRSLCITNHAVIAPQECHELPYQKGQSPTLAQHTSHCFQAIAAPRTSDETLMEARSRGHALEPLGLWPRLPPLALPWLSESGGVVGATSTGEPCSCSCEGHRRAHRSETAVLSTSLRLIRMASAPMGEQRTRSNCSKCTRVIAQHVWRALKRAYIDAGFFGLFFFCAM